MGLTIGLINVVYIDEKQLAIRFNIFIVNSMTGIC